MYRKTRQSYGHQRRSRSPSRKRINGFLSLILIGLIINALPAQSQPTFGQEDEEETAPVEAPPLEVLEFSESEEVIAGRLVASPIAAKARLMAMVEGVAQRRESGATGVYVATVNDEIELGIAYYTERVIEQAEEANALLLIFDIETWGGRVDAAVMMKDAILQTEIPTGAFINQRGISAGALIALANDLIVVVDGASIGAATPITTGGGTAQPVEEKFVSAFRSEFRATAEATARNGAVAESMVDARVEVGGIIQSGKLLTLTGQEALRIGFAEININTLDGVLALFDLEDAVVITIDESWSETLVRFLTSSAISGILMTLGMLGLFFELMSPGFGWAGGMGVICLLLFFSGHLLVNLAGMEEMLLFVGGVLLLLIEVFVIPGFGAAGVAGLLAILASLVLALVSLDMDLSFSPVGLTGAVSRVFFALIGTVFFSVLLFKYVPRTRFGRKLVLQEALASGSSVETPEDALSTGMTGVATTDLKPFGRAKFGSDRAEVVSEGRYVEKGEAVRISRVSGGRIEVRPVRPAPDDDPPSEAEQEDAEGQPEDTDG